VKAVVQAVALALVAASVRAAEAAVPPEPTLPVLLTLDEALRIFRERGLDLLIAEAAVRTAESGVVIAGAVANPVLSVDMGNAFTYAVTKASALDCNSVGAVCTPWVNSIGISDSAAIEDWLSGKRGLRQEVARNALAAAKMSRRDADRTIAAQVKSAYAQVAQAALGYRFAKEVAQSQQTTLEKFGARYRHGAIGDADLQRVEVQKLEADQALTNAEQALRQARVALAFLIGVRGAVPDFEVEASELDYSVPSALRGATEIGLLRMAVDHRPDLIALGYLTQQAEAQLRLNKRQQFPDITLSLNYSFGGFGGWSTNGSIQAPILTLGFSVPLPVFYSQKGEIRQAEAQFDAAALQRAKAASQVVNDVSTAWAAFVATRRLVERMEGPRRDGGGILKSARGAFDLVAIQYDKGAASLTDYLDALRTYVATRIEYYGDLANYWTAVYQLEAAVAMELR
jgi:cobalt-zinc-cadmium efflux system outer membrane protein